MSVLNDFLKVIGIHSRSVRCKSGNVSETVHRCY